MAVPHSSSGSALAAAGEQVPTLPDWLQDMQSPVQAESQQAPSTQKPEAHSAAAPHAWPCDLAPPATHIPPVQVLPTLQSAPVEQETRHVPAPSQA